MLTYEIISGIVDSLTWSDLVGQIEGGFLDCKRQIYDLSVENQKMELAKDVSSFANAGGGFILIGIETRHSQIHFSDEIVTLHPFEATIFDSTQYYSVLNTWVYPKLEGITIEWKPQATGSDRGFGVIVIPSQPQTKKPFLISKTLIASGRRADILVGYAERKRDTSEPATVTELHSYLRDGMGFQTNIGNQLAEILSRLSGERRTPHLPTEEITERVQKALEATGLNERKHFVLSAYPSGPTELPSLFSSSTDSITRLLEHPPTIRDGAFAVTTGDTARIIDGEFKRVGRGRKVLDLYPDGVLVFGCAADDRFLAHGITDFEERPRLNILALIEVTYHYCLLYAEVLQRLSPIPEEIFIRFQLGNVRPGGSTPTVFLMPDGHFGTEYEAPSNNTTKEIGIPAADFDPGPVSYRVLERIFRWFGIESQYIPFSEEVNGIRTISATQIQALR